MLAGETMSADAYLILSADAYLQLMLTQAYLRSHCGTNVLGVAMEDKPDGVGFCFFLWVS